MPIIHVHSVADFDAKITEHKLAVIDAFATWCGPCRVVAPTYEKFSNQYTNVAHLKFDVDECEELGEKLSISAMPTFVFFKNGAEVARVQGANPAALEAKIKELSGQ
jgi:thioredoxin 1